jgi:C-terminal processing protease CtpA/Prc
MFMFSTCDILAGKNGLGFDIRGQNPVFVSTVDKGGPAANAGLMPGNCILQVLHT